MTMSDMTYVLDTMLSRHFDNTDGILKVVDAPSSEAVEKQRRGPVGRVAAWAYLKAVWHHIVNKRPKKRLSAKETMQGYAIGMPKCGTRLCPVPEDIGAAAKLLMEPLFPDQAAMDCAYKTYPLSVATAAAIEAAKGQHWDCRFEAAALAALLESGACINGAY